ncbi:tRNA uridine-5-carboxymethylaminomethyl(34) synthesis GTPase MnmE [Methylonatrum kenyense]|uniref:tRNA uridine-5-carboxymethylaminomethyl(34) synthesis GTPase MnmE n=1 Tax=Methylonatrum kenyense TaxID=455253 RepID=UPI0020C11443|nr:tRNA uridine-5-carboxymethylaminomethyl(34) synthesis GTPase MnmE [Methylonatrum kenyense]
MQPLPDTICAIATPPGRGGIGVVRLSGPEAGRYASRVAGRLPEPRRAVFRQFTDAGGQSLDQGLLLWLPGPGSFTGEDVVEFHGHGGPVVLDRLMRRLTELGARPARPGEFSERAFLNGRLDLAQAEAIADLIAAGSEQGARAAMRSMSGEFSRRVTALLQALTELRVHVEAAIDFPEEEIDFLADGEVAAKLRAVRTELDVVLATARQGQILRDGMTVVIAGPPNAGKSSLLNQLAGSDSAIVTAIAGTTRDVLREQIQIDGMPLHIIDTAGLRDSDDPVEQEGVRRARQAMQSADRILLVVEDAVGVGLVEQASLADLPEDLPVTVVRNKIDLSGRVPGVEEVAGKPEIRLSALTGAGVDLLRQHLKQAIGFSGGEDGFIARRRHLDALRRTAEHLSAAHEQLHAAAAGELMAEELRQAQQHLGAITGAFSSEDLLGEIFSSFCIGK